jgi:hypothetical protein
MTITLRSTKGSPLTIAEADGNITDLDTRLTALEEGGAGGVGIASISVVGTQLTVTLTDGTTQGPFTLPKAQLVPATVNNAPALNQDGSWSPSALTANQYIRFSTPMVVAIPNAITIPAGTEYHIRAGGGGLTIPATLVKLNVPSGFLPEADATNATLTLKYIGTDGDGDHVWDVFGHLKVDAA